MYDLVFRNGRVVDGTGAPSFRGDVAVEGDQIARVGDLTGAGARRTLDLAGAVIAPGFIDLHTHADFTLPLFPRADAMVRQGVTTLVGGNCGFSPFPVRSDRLDLLRSYSGFLDAGLAWEWDSAAGFANHLETLPLACNVALQVGHGAVRIAVMGFDDRAPSASELEQMERLVADALEAGANALSTGLIYVPGSYSRTDEIVALARVAARYGGFYSSHIRGEGDSLITAVEEALTIGREASLPVQLSHHKALGRPYWGRVEASLAMIDQARASGQDVLADQYPYTAGSTTLAAIVPRWAMEGGISGLQRRLADPAARARIRAAIAPDAAETQALREREFDPEGIMISAVPEGPNKQYEGLMLPDIAARRGEEPVDSALHLLAAERGAVQMIAFGLAEADVRRVMRHPAAAVASDGWTLHPSAGGKPHPRSYGTYVRVLGHYVREEGVLALEEAVRKMTSLPAQRLGREDLGVIRAGGRADLVVFDPDRVADRATYHDPHQFAAGVGHVIVNGQVVIDEGEDTGVPAGRVLRRCSD
ncbi:MAG TPA: D-aminoacylase [Dehalococcoidia bacterium]|nr:D-aminoacylase [Dehalococcoidia bacterium]